MSKFGAHLSLGRHDGFGTALQQCANAGSPVPLIFALDQNVWPDIDRYSPQTTLIFRTQPSGYDNPPQIYTGDPVVIANDWYTACLPKWKLNQAHYYAPSNERNPLPEQDAWIDAFDLQMMRLADHDGLKLAIHGDSQGTPEISRWNNYRASLQHAAAHGHIVHVHEPVTGSGLAFRYRDIHAVTEQFAPGLLMAISECYGDLNGDWNHYVDSFMPYDAEAIRDPYLIGFGAYQLGGDENWYTAIQRWADYVASHPTPPAPPPDDEWVFLKVLINGIEYANPIFDYTTRQGVNTLHFVYQKKGTGEICTVEVTCDPVDMLYRVLQTPAGSVFNVGQTLHFEAT